MKQALISPLEPVEAGYRVAEVAPAAFEVAPPFFWAECADEVVADKFWYDPVSEALEPVPLPPEPEQPTVEGADTL